MSTLRNAEGAISGFFDRIFGRVFRGYVEPVELARKLAREMEDHKTVSVTRVYVPNEYVIYLSDRDHQRVASFSGALTQELATYLSERARHQGFTLLSDPQIRIENDPDLVIGAYGIACRVVDLPADGTEPAPPDTRDDADEFPQTSVRPLPAQPPFGPFTPGAHAGAPEPEPESAEAQVEEPEAAEDVAASEDPDVFVQADAVMNASSEAAADPIEVPVSDEADAVVEVPADPELVDLPEPVELDTAAPEEPPLAPAATHSVLEPDPHQQVWPSPAPPQAPAAPVAPTVPPTPDVVPPLIPDPVLIPDPIVPAARPLPPPGDYEPLAGVSGTQIFQPAASSEPLIQEEVSLIVDGRRNRLTRRTTTLGRSRECDIPVGDPNASRQHAEVRHIGLDYFLVDLNSTNGTYVNGQRIRRHALANGDRITIGTTEIVVEHVTLERG